MSDGRWWYLDLASDYPEILILSGGWGPEQELMLIELGERVLDAETFWLITRLYSTERDRHWAAVSQMFGMVIDAVRRGRTMADQVLIVLPGGDLNVVAWEEIPAGWRPDVKAWEEGRLP